MKPEGVRKVFAEQNAEGAIYYLAEELEKLRAELAAQKPVVQPEPYTSSVEEGN